MPPGIVLEVLSSAPKRKEGWDVLLEKIYKLQERISYSAVFCEFNVNKLTAYIRDFLAVLWLRLHTPNAGARGQGLVGVQDPTCCTVWQNRS